MPGCPAALAGRKCQWEIVYQKDHAAVEGLRRPQDVLGGHHEGLPLELQDIGAHENL